MPVGIREMAELITKQRRVLLLGAGASIPSGAPSATALAVHMATALSPELRNSNLPLSTLAELLELKHGRRRVVEVIRELLRNIKPVGGMLALPLFPWRSIYTTNYDTLLEQAYNIQSKPFNVIRSDYDYPAIEEADSITNIFKIHGCITQDRSFGDRPSFVLTDSDYISPSDYRENLFKRLELDIFGSGVLIIGQSLADKHLSDVVRSVAMRQAKYGYRDKVSILCYEPNLNLALIYEHQNVQVAFGGLDEFIDALHNCAVALPAPDVTPVSREGFQLPKELLAATINVEDEVKRKAQIDAMYSGRPANYPEIQSGFTFSRDIENEMDTRVSLGGRILPIIGVAGVGKTTASRRFLLSRQQQRVLCWEHKKGLPLRSDPWINVHANLVSSNRAGWLLIDNVTEDQREANKLIDHLGKEKANAGLFIITTAELSQWAPRQKSPEFFKNGGPFTLTQLSDSEVEGLLRVVNSNESIRNLISAEFKAKNPRDQKRHLLRQSKADMFVSLKVLFSSDSLDNIILKEYAHMEEGPRSIYKVVSALEAAGLTVHRQLVLRLLNIEPMLVSAQLKHLEGLIEEYPQNISEGIYVLRTRHFRIAEIVTKYKFSEEDEYLELLQKVVNNINPSVSIERRYIGELCNSPYGVERVSKAEARMELYESLLRIDPTNRIPRHRLIKENLDYGNIGAVSADIADAEDIVGNDPPIQRYKVLLLLEQSRQPGLLNEDRKAIVKNAYREANQGIDWYPENKYQYFVFYDVADEWLALTKKEDWLREAYEKLKIGYEKTLDPDMVPIMRRLERQLNL